MEQKKKNQYYTIEGRTMSTYTRELIESYADMKSLESRLFDSITGYYGGKAEQKEGMSKEDFLKDMRARERAGEEAFQNLTTDSCDNCLAMIGRLIIDSINSHLECSDTEF